MHKCSICPNGAPVALAEHSSTLYARGCSADMAYMHRICCSACYVTFLQAGHFGWRVSRTSPVGSTKSHRRVFEARGLSAAAKIESAEGELPAESLSIGVPILASVA